MVLSANLYIWLFVLVIGVDLSTSLIMYVCVCVCAILIHTIGPIYTNLVLEFWFLGGGVGYFGHTAAT